MATISDMTETTVGSVIYKDGAMVPGRTFTYRHYTISSCGRDFTVLSVYREGDYHLVVHAGRSWKVGTEETPTIDSAVAAAIEAANALGLTVHIMEEPTHAYHDACIREADIQNARDFPLSALPR